MSYKYSSRRLIRLDHSSTSLLLLPAYVPREIILKNELIILHKSIFWKKKNSKIEQRRQYHVVDIYVMYKQILIQYLLRYHMSETDVWLSVTEKSNKWFFLYHSLMENKIKNYTFIMRIYSLISGNWVNTND